MSLRTAKVGHIGSHAPGFRRPGGGPVPDLPDVRLQLHTLSLVQFIERVQSAVPADADRKPMSTKLKALALPFKAILPSKRSAGRTPRPPTSRYYVTMRDLMQEFSLNALARAVLAGAAQHCRPLALPGRLAAFERRRSRLDRRRCRRRDWRVPRLAAGRRRGLPDRLAGARRHHDPVLAPPAWRRSTCATNRAATMGQASATTSTTFAQWSSTGPSRRMAR